MLSLVPPSVPPAQPLPALTPARGVRRARVALLAGCAQQVLAPDIGAAAIRVLSQCGVEVIVPPGQGCCGALALHVGDHERARQRARVNVAAFPDDVDAVVTTAAGCGSGMQEYPHLFEGAADAAAATALARRTVDVSAFIEQLGVTLAPAWPEPITVAYHDACHLRHAQRVVAEPRALLGADRQPAPRRDRGCRLLRLGRAPTTSISRRWRTRSASARRRRCWRPARRSSPAATSAA